MHTLEIFIVAQCLLVVCYLFPVLEISVEQTLRMQQFVSGLNAYDLVVRSLLLIAVRHFLLFDQRLMYLLLASLLSVFSIGCLNRWFYVCWSSLGLQLSAAGGLLLLPIWATPISLLPILVAKKLTDRSHEQRYDRHVHHLYSKYQKRFRQLMMSLKQNTGIIRSLLCILIIEDSNRPKLFRYGEELLSFIRKQAVSTRGIMQTSSSVPLSDTESIKAALKHLQEILAQLDRSTYPDSVRYYADAAAIYNGGFVHKDSDYADHFLDIWNIIAYHKRISQ